MNVLDLYRAIGSDDDQGRGPSAAPAPLFNLHVHLPPNFSAFDSIADLVAQARAENIRILGVTNYYDHRVYDTFCAAAADAGILPLFGLEIMAQVADLAAASVRVNDPNNPGRMYLCGKAIAHYAAPPPRAAAVLDFIRTSDRDRMAEMIRRLSERFAAAGIDVPSGDAPVIADVAGRCGCPPDWVTLQERHVARAMQEAFCRQVPADERAAALGRVLGQPVAAVGTDPAALQGVIRSGLLKAGKPAFVTENFVSFEQARGLILDLGGIPCYPTLADGADPRCEYEADLPALVDDLRQRGIHAAEFIPVRNTPGVLERYAAAYREAGIIVVAGTEHNTAQRIPLDPRCRGGEPLPAGVRALAFEGACVCVAHQYRTARGEPGYVSADGTPAPGFASADERIAHFARLGRTVMQAYWTSNPGP